MRPLDDALRGNGRPDLAALLEAIPYCRFLGVKVDRKGSEITTIMPFAPHLIGNPILPALHGGAIGAFMETTAILQVAFETGGARLPKPVNIAIEYLRPGKPADTYARAVITKLGRRIINVHVDAWQDEHAKPIAALRGHFMAAADQRE
jgi:acyl-coenzyme A thioesterase PaaI-like protein